MTEGSMPRFTGSERLWQKWLKWRITETKIIYGREMNAMTASHQQLREAGYEFAWTFWGKKCNY